MKLESSKIIALTCTLGTTFCITPNLTAADYFPPKKDKIMFELDKIPMDRDMMVSLSATLSNLVKPNQNQDRKTHDLNAQLISLALRLNPTNTDAKELNDALANKRAIRSTDLNQVRKSTKRLEKAVQHLSTSSTGIQTKYLENFLKDVLVQVEPDNPKVRGHKIDAERWSGILVTSDALPKQPVIPPKPPVKPQPDAPGTDKPTQPNSDSNKANPDQPDSNKGTPDTPPQKKNVKWASLPKPVTATLSLVQKVNDKEKHIRGIHAIEMGFAMQDSQESKLDLKMEPTPNGDLKKKISDGLTSRLKEKYGSFQNVQIDIRFDHKLSERSLGQFMAPAMLQLVASAEGVEMREDLAITGDLWSKNVLGRSGHFWDLLKTYRKSLDGKRLLCPLTAREDFKHIVILEEPEFFVKNEVIAVKDIDEALTYSAEEIEDENLQLASELYAEIQERIGKRSVGAFSVDKKIQEKLRKILELNPNHISAEMILFRGDNARTTKYSSKYLAYELQNRIKSLKWISEQQASSLNAKNMRVYSDSIKDQVKQLKRYVSSKDSKVLDALEKVALEFNNIGRAREKTDSSYHKRAAINAHKRFVEEYEDLKKFVEESLKEE